MKDALSGNALFRTKALRKQKPCLIIAKRAGFSRDTSIKQSGNQNTEHLREHLFQEARPEEPLLPS